MVIKKRDLICGTEFVWGKCSMFFSSHLRKEFQFDGRMLNLWGVVSFRWDGLWHPTLDNYTPPPAFERGVDYGQFGVLHLRKLITGDLQISAGLRDREHIRVLYEDYKSEGRPGWWYVLQAEILEDVLCNSEIRLISPEDIGALTDGTLLGIVEEDDQGKIVSVDRVWWDAHCAVIDWIEQLIEIGEVIFEGSRSE